MFCFLKSFFKSRKISNRKLLENIMATVDEIKSVLEDVKSNNAEVKAKVDVVIEKLNEFKNQPQSGATPEQLDEVLALANEVKSGLQSTEDSVDAVA